MGMSTHIVGFKEPDETWIKYKKVWDACEEAKVIQPDDVLEYFGDNYPDPSGVEVELEGTEAVKSFNRMDSEGFEIDLSKLPKHVSKIRFYNSY